MTSRRLGTAPISNRLIDLIEASSCICEVISVPEMVRAGAYLYLLVRLSRLYSVLLFTYTTILSSLLSK
jgi:hypothetical protein